MKIKGKKQNIQKKGKFDDLSLNIKTKKGICNSCKS